MATAARKARKRAGVPFSKPAKTPTRRWIDAKPRGLGLLTGAEILASLVVRGVP